MIYKVRELLLWTVLWILTLQYLLQLLIRLVSEKKGKKTSPLNKEENDSQISNNKHIKLKNHLFQCLSCRLVTHAHNCLARLFSPHTAILCLWGINWKRATLTESWEEHTNSKVELNQQTSRFSSWAFLKCTHSLDLATSILLETAKCLPIWVNKIKERVPPISKQLYPSESTASISPDILTIDPSHLIALTLLCQHKTQGTHLPASRCATLQGKLFSPTSPELLLPRR